MNTHLKGVGGWLNLLIVGLCILGPLVSCGQSAGDFAKAEAMNPSLTSLATWETFKTYINWALIFSLAITFSAGYRLWKIHTPQSVHFAILAMWIAAPVSVLLQIVAAHFSIGTATLSSAGDHIADQVIRSWIVALVWTLYLLKSKRVRNTYYPSFSSVATDVQSKNQPSPATPLVNSRIADAEIQPRANASIAKGTNSRLLGTFNPFLSNSESMRRQSIGLAAVVLIAWFAWVGVKSNGFSTINPMGWLVLFGAPVLAYLLLLAALHFASKAPDYGRYLLSATFMWTFLVGAWGFIWDWENQFTAEQYTALFLLPPAALFLGFLLWRWSKST